jgi:hypothetical protein
MSGGLNRRQAFASHAAAIGQRGFAALARIAVKKSVLPFAADFRWLILAFHKLIRLPSGRKTGACEDNHETPRVKAQLIAVWSCVNRLLLFNLFGEYSVRLPTAQARS